MHQVIAELLRTWKALRSRYWLSLTFDVLLIAAVFWAVHAWNTRDLPGDEPMPALHLPLLDGDRPPVDIAGTGPGVVYFFAPWCFYCRNSIDNLDDLADSGDIAWARAVALEYGSVEAVREFVAETGLRQPVLLGNRQTAGDWNIRAFPTYFVIDSNGNITGRSVGYSTRLGLWARARLARSD